MVFSLVAEIGGDEESLGTRSEDLEGEEEEELHRRREDCMRSSFRRRIISCTTSFHRTVGVGAFGAPETADGADQKDPASRRAVGVGSIVLELSGSRG